MCYRNQDLSESSQVFVVAPAGRHRDVNRSSFPVTCACFFHPPCPGIKGIFVSGEVKHSGVGIERILSSITVMDIEVDDKNTAKTKCAHSKPGGDSHIVEYAEAHCSVRNGMMPRWSDQGKGAVHLSSHHSFHGNQ